MYEFHGWIKLAESSSEIDEGTLHEKISELEQKISQHSWSNGKAEILLMNGFFVLLLNAIPNRRRSEASEMQEILDFVTEKFKGAHGLIYEYDEGIKTTYGKGMYSVKVIKRGKCSHAIDPFLSPTCPVVEDP